MRENPKEQRGWCSFQPNHFLALHNAEGTSQRENGTPAKVVRDFCWSENSPCYKHFFTGNESSAQAAHMPELMH